MRNNLNSELNKHFYRLLREKKWEGKKEEKEEKFKKMTKKKTIIMSKLKKGSKKGRNTQVGE